MPNRVYHVGMIGNTSHQNDLFYAAFGVQAALIRDDLLDRLDALLEEPALLEIAEGALARRFPGSIERGRFGMSPDRLLRTYVLKHLRRWSFRDLEREVRGSLLYRRFARFGADPIPDHSTFCRNFRLLGGAETREIHKAIVSYAQSVGAAQGKKLRIDPRLLKRTFIIQRTAACCAMEFELSPVC